MGRIPYWGCKSNLCGADLEGGGASNLTGADRGRMWIGAVSPASLPGRLASSGLSECDCLCVRLSQTVSVTITCIEYNSHLLVYHYETGQRAVA